MAITFEDFDNLKQRLIHLNCALQAQGRLEEAEKCLNQIGTFEQSYLTDSATKVKEQCEKMLDNYTHFLKTYDAEVL